MIGRRFARLLVMERVGTDKNGKTRYKCVCDCGTETIVPHSSLTSGATRSCGCLAREMTIARLLKHGQARSGKKTGIYKIWKSMRQRCQNPTDKAWSNYGGRGITICDRWQDFSKFYSDMGDPPKGLSLERIDNNGGYSPENCIWASFVQQNRNTRQNRRLSVCSKEMILTDACNMYRVNKATMYKRAKRLNITLVESFFDILEANLAMPENVP